MWKTTPTASLQILLNKKPSHLEVISVGIKTYIRCKELFQNNHWDGIADNRSANSHLKTLKVKCNQISHEGTPLDEFVSNFMKEPHYSWNPPIRPTPTSVGINDINDYPHNIDTSNAADDDNDDNNYSPSVGNNDTSGRSNRNRMVICPLRGDAAGHLSVNEELSSNPLILPEAEISQGSVTPNNQPTLPGAVFSQGSVTPNNQSTLPRAVFSQGSVVPQNLLIPNGISKLTELTLDQFKNNFRLVAQKLVMLIPT